MCTRPLRAKGLNFIVKYVLTSQMALRDATHFREGRHLFQHGQHLKDVSKRWFGDIPCFSRLYLLHPTTRYVAPCFISPLAPNGVPSVGMLLVGPRGVWTLLSYSRPGFWACGDFTLKVGVKSLCWGKIYILSPDSWLLTPTSASKSCMKETELASPLSLKQT